MAIDIQLSKIGISMTEGSLAEWLIADGGHATEGEPLFALENGKSTNEIDSTATGGLRIPMPGGENYEIRTLLGVHQ
ncbi:pyruvate/2-oxoglutarate dehydrogenase complex dihydrolipoamide acyltransferase (E2) component [Sphingobium wenxiniae]|uniref:Biotin-dependent enzyme n=1 Tax=Sphingobium wenxiniae (strain DSM 21828 / CGMCC 1.7748 / JZ-1) TaxID=595605 RepID=A0A562KE05_SPHWJ|nr:MULTISPECIES: lipoyl domain-containing protein [Sphingobium]MBB6193865.1 pyruvate/2-oxoglutarate dehydrogenase complex dihydrolipoamide acyltransferase (E2) component [Sphingobium wenxiniae]TWH93640.1 biotin-dependent enzyme [Sphingobium wenxiniae]WRD75333.1 lipoyl domain-containing protein [Sphingobium baderi]